MVNSKRKRGCKAVDVDNDCNEIDRISNLGDGLISHILSYLTTLEAVATSVLSKRWKNVWTETPALYFSPISCSNNEGEQRDRLASFITHVLDMNQILHLQEFSCFIDISEYEYDRVHINTWFKNLSKRRIDKIDLSLQDLQHKQDLIQLLLDFLTSTQPEQLSLSCCPPYCTEFDSEGFTTLKEFSNLKVIRLECLDTLYTPSMNRLLASCPVLENLTIYHGRWNHIDIDSSTLKHLTLHCTDIPSLFLKAPNLQKLVVCCEELGRDYYHPMEGLSEAMISFDSIPLALLEAISCAKTLDLKNYRPMNKYVRRAISCNQLSFKNLTHLKLLFQDDSLQSMMVILKACPILRSFMFRRAIIIDCSGEKWITLLPVEYVKWTPPADVPECLLSRLESVEIDSRIEGECEDCYCLAGYFLKNAGVLREFKLNTCIEDSSKEIILHKQLLMLPKVSASCQVMFTNSKSSDL